MTGGRSGASILRDRNRRLGVVETASVDARRKLVLVRRDNVEHLIMTGAPIDVLIQTDIEGHGRLEPSIETVIIARSGMRPAPDFDKGPDARTPGKR